MRLQLIVLLALVVVSGDTSATTATSARSIVVNQDDIQVKQLLRSDATDHVDKDEGERATWSNGLTNLIKPRPKMLTKLEMENLGLANLAKKYDLTGAFKSLKLKQFKNVDELFTSKNYKQWFSYMVYWNSQSKNKHFTVAKMFNKQFGSKKAFQIFTDAAASSHPDVKRMGEAYQVQLFKEFHKAGDNYKKIIKRLNSEEAAGKMFAAVIKSPSQSDKDLGESFAIPLLNKWAKEGKLHEDVVKIDRSLDEPYVYVLTNKIHESQGDATAKAKAALEAAQAKAARARVTRV
ncbi:hypothetical protein PHMEG_00023681 [Phytophthora megakarya]|uniref:RxLR effector protein n=1 Tax=Phytophthora megakarya TaxID=4795 RepID=A0A225VGG3_9STRA|nr:hypothetical protein PHMEG_00023681 [Phytophthora megakarya]